MIFGKIYDSKEILEAKHQLLSRTRMVDFGNSVYQALHGKKEPAYEKRRSQVMQQLQVLKEAVEPLLDTLQDQSFIQQLKQNDKQTVETLRQTNGITSQDMTRLYQYARLQYDVGNYTGASQLLFHFRVLSADVQLNTSALWGKLSADILAKQWDAALDQVYAVRETIDNSSSLSQQEQLHQRAWLLHWSLFVSFNHPKGCETLIELFFSPAYLSCIQTVCPWIIRYLVAAVVVTKRRHTYMKELLKLVRLENMTYCDPITDLIDCLYVRYDFDAAQHKLTQCSLVLEQDFFLHPFTAAFIEASRHFIFEMYCRIHQRIDIDSLSARLNMDTNEGEKWIVNLIRDARMDAKIDSESNTVVMNVQYQSIYQQVMERTKALGFRSSILASNIEKREVELKGRFRPIAITSPTTTTTTSGKKNTSRKN